MYVIFVIIYLFILYKSPLLKNMFYNCHVLFLSPPP